MERLEFKQVSGELTEAIIDDFASDLGECLCDISAEYSLPNTITAAEIYFLATHSDLSFFDHRRATEFADCYNFIQLTKASPEQIAGLVRKLLFPKELIYSNKEKSPLVAASKYFLPKINGIIMGRDYTSKIESHDEIYLKFLQALHSSFDYLAIEKMQSYNIIQEEVREKCQSRSKLKQIESIGSKFGYGISLK